MLDSLSHRFLLEQGWTPYAPNLDLDYFLKTCQTEGQDVLAQALRTASTIATTLGRQDSAWWANLLNLSSSDVRDSIASLWSLITPNPVKLSRSYPDRISAVHYCSGHYNKEIEAQLQNQIALCCIDRIVESLGTPDLILQQINSQYDGTETWFELPQHRFESISSLRVDRFLLCLWRSANISLIHDIYDRSERKIILKGQNLKPVIDPVLQTTAIRSIDKRTVSGLLQSPFKIEDYTPDVQKFAQDIIAQADKGQRFAALATGEAGTGKTKCMLAIAKLLQSQGFLVLVTDHETVLNFDPPDFVEKVVFVINEVDNWAIDRALDRSGKTEKVLSLLDGSTHESVLPNPMTTSHKPIPQMVFLMTANTIERADHAMLRSGRIDLYHHFNHQYVSSIVSRQPRPNSNEKERFTTIESL
ncbi:AAA family ATPase [Leptolyngbya sp. AN03gr2]|uniref:AAA family ATPase n=1 Tax=unclassified Leptolyngbya TaxID=2650499 RepID=UPI003D31F227